MTPVELVLSKLEGARPSGNGWAARCPAHEDRKPSLSVAGGEGGRALVRCHAGCSTEAVCEALGLTLADLMPPRNDPQVLFGGRPVPKPTAAPKPQGKAYATANDAVKALQNLHGKPSAMWTYHDATGQSVGVVVRWDRADGKDIRPVARYPDGWRIAHMPNPRPLFGLPELAEVRTVLVVEGEPCVEAARVLGFAATTSSGGAKAATKTDWSPLAGKEVWILPDYDAPGRKYAGDVAAALAALNPPPVIRSLDPRAAFGREHLPTAFDLADARAACTGADDRNRLRAGIESAARQLVSSTSAPPPGRPVPDLLCFADVVPTEVRWLWLARFALGRLTVLVGRPGEGKSFFTCDMGARVSTGTDWPDGTPATKGDVLLICAEDDPGDTIAPRLLAAGANMRRVHLLRAAKVTRASGEEATVAFDLSNIDLIRDALAKLPECKLVVVDPVGSYLGGGVDAHRDNEVRAVLAPLGQLAAERGVAVVLVAHTRKAAVDFADDAILGSRAFSGIARSVLHLMSDREDRTRKLLLAGKNNLSVSAPGLAFTITGDPARLEWEPDPVDLSADDLMPKSSGRGNGAKRGPEPEKHEAAVEWLLDVLADGPMNVGALKTEADDAGLAWATVRRAQQTLNIKPKKEKVKGGPWYWELPEGAQRAAAARRCSSNEEPEHLRDSPDETDENSQKEAEGAQDSDNLSTFAQTDTTSGTEPASRTGADPDGEHLFANPPMNLPD
jgi:hypothetical protein